MANLTHLDDQGKARMVDVGEKDATRRTARAAGRVLMKPETLALILDGTAAKGDVLAAARIAGIMAAKQTASLIPLCHPLAISRATVDFGFGPAHVDVEATVSVEGKTGVEMEALTAVSVACLTLYDMLKAVDRGMTLTNIRLLEKHGGKSGHWQAEG